MLSRLVALTRASIVSTATIAILASPCHAVPEPDLAKGIRQAQEGEYQAAEATLRTVIERLSGKPESEQDLARAYIYLAVACVGSNREEAGRKAFLEALKLRPDIRTSPTEFPPSFTQFFDTVREEAWASGTVARPETSSGASGKGKWLLIGGGVAAAGTLAAVLLSSRSNTAPVAGQVAVSPAGLGISGATSFSFSAPGASDPDGDSLTFAWDFGDGATGAGATVQHVYAVPATFSVALTVDDGEATASAGTSLTTRTLSGVWVNEHNGVTRTWTIVQDGQQLTGTYHNDYYSPIVGTGVLSGTVRSPRHVTVESSLPGVGAFSFEGEADDNIDTLTGQVNGAGIVDVTLTFTRQ